MGERIADAVARALSKIILAALRPELARIDEKLDRIIGLMPVAENLLRAIERDRRRAAGRHPMFRDCQNDRS